MITVGFYGADYRMAAACMAYDGFCLQEAKPRLAKVDLEFVILQWLSHSP